MTQQPPVGQNLIIIEDSLSHSHTPHSVGLLWKSDQPDQELYLTKQNAQNREFYAPDGIRTHNLSRPAAANPRLRPRGLWEWRV